jgi:hypothetical protein
VTCLADVRSEKKKQGKSVDNSEYRYDASCIAGHTVLANRRLFSRVEGVSLYFLFFFFYLAVVIHAVGIFFRNTTIMIRYYHYILAGLGLWWVLLLSTAQESIYLASRRAVPATTTSYTKNNNNPWWDVLPFLLLTTYSSTPSTPISPLIDDPRSILEDPITIQQALSDPLSSIGVAVLPDMNLRKDHDAVLRARNISEQYYAKSDTSDPHESAFHGILIFLSVKEQLVHISQGHEHSKLRLTYDEMKEIIRDMKPFLLQRRYDEAVLKGIHSIQTILKAKRLSVELTHLGYFSAVIIMLVACREWNDQKRRSATLQYELTAEERTKALELQKQFQDKECPICLQDFGSGRRKLLRCGHTFDESCWRDWVSSSRGRRCDQCPVCRDTVTRRDDEQGPDKMQILIHLSHLTAILCFHLLQQQRGIIYSSMHDSTRQSEPDQVGMAIGWGEQW